MTLLRRVVYGLIGFVVAMAAIILYASLANWARDLRDPGWKN